METRDIMNADHDWTSARRKLLYREVVCFFRGCSVDLQSFNAVHNSQNLHQYVDRGLQTIPMERIIGSVGRYNDFSENFMPRNPQMKDRWEKVDTLMRQGKTPPIDVYLVGGDYYVVDGNHRVSVAKHRKLKTIQAYVTEFMSAVEEIEGESFDSALIRAEKEIFLNNVGPSNGELAREIVFTCSRCYKDLADLVETYRQGYEATWPMPMTYEEAFAAWHKEVYAPSVNAIRANQMLADFPNRTEADLFIWTWENNQTLEDLVGKEDIQAA